MHVVLIDMMLNGEIHQQLNSKLVTIPELAILRHIHGKDAVYNVRPVPKTMTQLVRDKEGKETGEIREIPWAPTNTHEKALVANSQNEERDRLRKTYGRERNGHNLIADIVFPGAIVKLPDTLEEIGMSPADMAASMRRKAQELLDAAEAMVAGEDKKPNKKEAA